MPKQVQIRRDTAANVAGITPAAGEMFYSTDTDRTSIGDGSVAGGIWSGGPLLNATEFIQGTDAAGTGKVNIVGVDASDRVVLQGVTHLKNNVYLASIDNAGTGIVNIARVKADDTIEIGAATTFTQNVALAAGKTFGIASGFQIDASSNLTAVGDVSLIAGAAFGIASGFNIDTNDILTGGGKPAGFGSGTGGFALAPTGVTYIARTGNGDVMEFLSGTGIAGDISVSGTTTTYGTSSDPRLKDFLPDPSDADINSEFTKLRGVCKAFKFNGSDDETWGFNAHDAIDAELKCGLGYEGKGPRNAELGSVYQDEDGNDLEVSPGGVDNGKPMALVIMQLDLALKRIAALEAA